jgi:hypothetical protein
MEYLDIRLSVTTSKNKSIARSYVNIEYAAPLGMLFAGVGFAVERRDSHPLHLCAPEYQSFHAFTANFDPLRIQLVEQHASPHERILRMQFIELVSALS